MPTEEYIEYVRLHCALERTVNFLGNHAELTSILEEGKCLLKLSLWEDSWKPQGERRALFDYFGESLHPMIFWSQNDAFGQNCNIPGLHIHKEIMLPLHGLI